MFACLNFNYICRLFMRYFSSKYVDCFKRELMYRCKNFDTYWAVKRWCAREYVKNAWIFIQHLSKGVWCLIKPWPWYAQVNIWKIMNCNMRDSNKQKYERKQLANLNYLFIEGTFSNKLVITENNFRENHGLAYYIQPSICTLPMGKFLWSSVQ